MSEGIRPSFSRAHFAILLVVIAVLYVPLVVMVANSFLDSGPRAGGWTPRWYREVFADLAIWQALGRSLAVAFISAAVATVLGTAAALALDKWFFPGRLPLRGLSTLSLMMPELVLALSLLSWFAVFQLELSLVTVVIAHVTLTLPFVILVIGARLRGLDLSVEDAARDLGASEWRVLSRVTLPLLKPAIVTGYLLAFLLSFDDFLVTYYTNGAGGDTLPVRLYSLMKTGLSPKLQALSSLMLAISMVLIILLVRWGTTSTRDNPR